MANDEDVDDDDDDDDEDEEGRQRLADRVLSGVEDALYWGIAVVLAFGSVALLVAQFNTLLRLRNTSASTLMLEILDGLLLLFIFVELMYAVRACLRSHEIVAEPFLVVGILAGIKEIVVLSVEAATLLEGPGVLSCRRRDRRIGRCGARSGVGGVRVTREKARPRKDGLRLRAVSPG
jgi:uncharacterized membrane protein (DUF373 family)